MELFCIQETTTFDTEHIWETQTKDHATRHRFHRLEVKRVEQAEDRVTHWSTIKKGGSDS